MISHCGVIQLIGWRQKTQGHVKCCNGVVPVQNVISVLDRVVHDILRMFLKDTVETSSTGLFSFYPEISDITLRPRKRYPFWAVLKIQYSTVQPDFFYQGAILCCHKNPVANSLQGPKQVANIEAHATLQWIPIWCPQSPLWNPLHRTDITTMGCPAYVKANIIDSRNLLFHSTISY